MTHVVFRDDAVPGETGPGSVFRLQRRNPWPHCPERQRKVGRNGAPGRSFAFILPGKIRRLWKLSYGRMLEEMLAAGIAPAASAFAERRSGLMSYASCLVKCFPAWFRPTKTWLTARRDPVSSPGNLGEGGCHGVAPYPCPLQGHALLHELCSHGNTWAARGSRPVLPVKSRWHHFDTCNPSKEWSLWSDSHRRSTGLRNRPCSC